MECSMLNRAPESIPAPRPEARQPRGAVKLNGKIVPGWDSLEVGNNAYRSADTFRVVFAVSQCDVVLGTKKPGSGDFCRISRGRATFYARRIGAPDRRPGRRCEFQSG